MGYISDFLYSLPGFFLVILVFSLGTFTSKKIMFYSEKMSPFECGFTPKYNSRLPFSIRFFLVSIIFLVFDVELVLIFPYILSLNRRIFILSISLLLIFLIILVLGLFHE